METLDEFMGAFKGLIVIRRGASGVHDDVGKVLTDRSLKFIGDVIADGDGK